jgi:hypothetical protein
MGRSREEIKLICPNADVSDGLAIAGAQLLIDQGRIGRWAKDALEKAK